MRPRGPGEALLTCGAIEVAVEVASRVGGTEALHRIAGMTICYPSEAQEASLLP